MTSRGLSSPVIVPKSIDWERDYSCVTVEQLVGMSNEELAAVDPVAMNLIVAKGLPALANIDIRRYQKAVDRWVLDLNRRCLPMWEPSFHREPHDFKDDIRYFRLGMVCQYLELEAGIQYRQDQRDITSILYTDPTHVFLNGVIDSGEGTCATLATLQLAMGWRMGWPVSLACINAHYILRFDDGETTHNIETTQSGHGGFKSDPDEFLIREHRLSPLAINSGSELRALRPRELLGAFIGLRARHRQDVGKSLHRTDLLLESESDWLLARYLFPTNRSMYRDQMVAATLRGETLFEPNEAGHPQTHPALLNELRKMQSAFARSDGDQAIYAPPLDVIDDFFASMEVAQ